MSASDLAAVIVAVVCLLAVGVLTVVAISLVRTIRSMRETVDVLREQTIPLVADLRDVIDQADAELAKVDEILDTADTISSTVDAASRLTYRAISPPLIKTASIVAGAGRARRRMRRGSEPATITSGPDRTGPKSIERDR